jgi:hypothetical protein
MIGFGLVFLLILYLIYKNAFWGWVTIPYFKNASLALIFFFKGLGVLTFYAIYQYYYGDIFNFDSGLFFKESKLLNNMAFDNFGAYLKTLFGFQDNYHDNYIYENLIKPTRNWQDGRIDKFFFNDNRTVIRVNSVLHFLAFDNYLILALYNCLISYLGVILLFKSFEVYLTKYKKLFFISMCFMPSLWLHSAAVLKEPLTLFLVGALVFLIYQMIVLKLNRKIRIVFLTLGLFIAFYLKPFIVYPVVFTSALFFWLSIRPNYRYKLVFCVISYTLAFGTINLITYLSRNKSAIEIALNKQKVFLDAATGGIFLLDNTKFVRLNYDTTLIKQVRDKVNHYTINYNVPYIYWEHSHQQDTLYCGANTDTNKVYSLVYKISKSQSNLVYPKDSWSNVGISFYYAIAFPLFYNAKGTFMWLVSMENFMVLCLLLITFWFLVRARFNAHLFLILLLVLSLLFLIGITTGNVGAINRYRSLILPFISFAFFYSISLFKSNN